MSVACSSKNLIFPINVLKSLLLYSSGEDVISDCKYYGLEIRGNGICFLKSCFDDNKREVRKILVNSLILSL